MQTDTSDIVRPEDRNAHKDRFMDILFQKYSAPFPRVGDVVEGIVIYKEGSRVFVDLDASTGVIYGREYQRGRETLRNIAPGARLAAKVIELENEDGYIELSICEADKDRVWKELEAMKSAKEVVTLKALEANKGGLVFDWKGMKGFLPVSQLSSKNYPRVEGGDKERILGELAKFVGAEFPLVVMDINRRESKLIFSEKAALPEEVRKDLEQFTVGEIYEGTVTGVVDFGVFVELKEGVEGLVHISELDWSLVENPSNSFKQGDKVQVKIIGIEGDKISLSIKALKEDPWKVAAYQKGDIVEGKVTKLSKIGAFVQVLDKNKPDVSGRVFGLSHVSEFGSPEAMARMVERDKVYPFQIALFNADEHRLSLLFLGNESKVQEIPKVESPSGEA